MLTVCTVTVSWQNPRLKTGIKTISWCCNLSSDQSPVCLINNSNNNRPLRKMKSCIQTAGVVDRNNRFDVNTSQHVWIRMASKAKPLLQIFFFFFIEGLYRLFFFCSTGSNQKNVQHCLPESKVTLLLVKAQQWISKYEAVYNLSKQICIIKGQIPKKIQKIKKPCVFCLCFSDTSCSHFTRCSLRLNSLR